MKRILISLSIIAVVAVVVIGATTAYFSDSETAIGNTFTAGVLDLKVNGENPLTSYFTISNVAPGDSDSTSIVVENIGTVNGASLTVVLKNIVGTEGANPESETGDTSEPGELCDNVNISLAEGATTYYDGLLSGFTSIVDTGALNASSSRTFTLSYSVPTSAGNDIQGDVCTYDIEIVLNQVATP